MVTDESCVCVVIQPKPKITYFMKKYKLILMAVLFSSGLVSCSSDDDSAGQGNEENANVRFELTDAPGDYKEVNVEVVDVLIHSDASVEAEGADEEGWISVGNVNAEVINLLELTGGVTHLLAETELEAGKLNQIRLVLGGENSLVTEDGTRFALETPSAQQSGLKLQVNEVLEAGKDYTFLLDFDVEQSVVKTGTNYSLKPVIRVSTQEAGSIVGSVHPTTHQALVVATNGTTTVSAYTDAEGNFELHGLPAGTYMVTVTPDVALGLSASVVNNVAVAAGAETDLEVVFLE